MGISLNDAIDLNEKHVSPWERGALADPAMRAERDPLGLLLGEHMWFSREAAYGGRGVGGFAGLGVLATLGLILLGGLALNLTPCVLPMIPINLAILGAGRENRDRRRSIVLGGAYGAGMALAYGGLGLVVVLGLAKLGYVPRFCDRHITHMLAEGVALMCEIARVDPNSPPWEAVAVRIWPVAVDSAFDAESANRHFGPE